MNLLELIREPGREYMRERIREPIWEPIKQPIRAPIRERIKKPIREPSREHIKKPIEEPIRKRPPRPAPPRPAQCGCTKWQIYSCFSRPPVLALCLLSLGAPRPMGVTRLTVARFSPVVEVV